VIPISWRIAMASSFTATLPDLFSEARASSVISRTR
jgi:hypothetical protein